ncbi:c-type cytochrome [Aliiroseovarius sp. F20344]|uniref:c-type cytochrome n=1 Tax=Aliiroseovarius sp. F20344 TaxID=2926414 RepID=UPI001FF1ABC5|nr:c-type cytochrome [Aliiroseovarius sp. F20344]MCK0142165.1 cytochrome c [Aliiroseovarius sp. F20344]
MLKYLSKISATIAFASGLMAQTVLADMPGEDQYLSYCASCHGIAADGNGPLGDVLSMSVPDLTTIAQRNDGNFPFLKVVHMVDGRSGVIAHGSDMPVWGDQFTAKAVAGDGMLGDLSSVYEVRGRILSLVYYLESIQK